MTSMSLRLNLDVRILIPAIISNYTSVFQCLSSEIIRANAVNFVTCVIVLLINQIFRKILFIILLKVLIIQILPVSFK